MKKVIFLMIDSLMPEILEESIKQNKVPVLALLKQKGMYWDKCTTSFPTMTASVDFSLVTGEYPNHHKVPSLVWYNSQEKRIINYMNGGPSVLRLGLSSCVKDVLCNLNDKHLSKNVKTVYEELADLGKTSGSINFIAHRGKNKYKIDPPFFVKLATGFTSFEDISGPDLFTLGSLAQSQMDPPLPWRWDQSVFRHYGINDEFAIRVLTHCIDHQILPDFTMVYLPDNDHKVHVHPENAVDSLEMVDQNLQKVFNRFSSWDEALDNYVFIVTGDHGQTIIGKSKDHNIELEPILQGLNIARYGNRPAQSDDLVIANNERMSFIYPLKDNKEAEIVSLLQKDPRIDLIAWKEGERVAVCSGVQEGTCRFQKNGEITDRYGERWTVEGDEQVLDLHISEDNKSISFGEFPDVLSRIYGSLYSQEIQMVICTAKPGYEFKSAYAPTHLGGGSHGSLHRIDSTIPLIVSGIGNEGTRFPSSDKEPRIVDLKKYIVSLFTS
jgi:predicted AlkP superfamily pyrophosphatase or phosphodiesterase